MHGTMHGTKSHNKYMLGMYLAERDRRDRNNGYRDMYDMSNEQLREAIQRKYNQIAVQKEYGNDQRRTSQAPEEMAQG